MNTVELANRFSFHKSREDTIERHLMLRRATYELAKEYCRGAPEGRELALALTNLEQALFWVNSAIARSDIPTGKKHQKVEPEFGSRT